jgi:predicted CoA-substrate-specific enzyme activase
MAEKYGLWPESNWASRDIDWKKSKNVNAGVDIGAVSSQAVIMCDGQVLAYSNQRTGPSSKVSARKVMESALEGTGMGLKNIRQIVATGYGSGSVEFANKCVNETVCHVKGARFMFGPTVKTVFDMGGQTCKAMKLYQWDQIVDLAVNDKCAVNMGWGIEILADLMHVQITEMGQKSLDVKQEPEPVSTTCYVFANTEAIGLLRAGGENEALAAYLFAIAGRLQGLLGRINPEKEFAFTGGLAKNLGIVKRLEREMGIVSLGSRYDPQLAGAIGAAILAAEPAKTGGKQALKSGV